MAVSSSGPDPSKNGPTPAVLCSNCGTYCPVASGFASDDQRRVSELEAQVKILTRKATEAADRIADYEDELRGQKSDGTSSPPSRGGPSPNSFQSRFGGLLGGLKAAAPEVKPEVAKANSDLQAALQREQSLRQKAEGKVSQMNNELEDLSAQLFQEANEMVKNERDARMKLEERVEVLEKRDIDKRKRLERLENALKRIDRIRTLIST